MPRSRTVLPGHLPVGDVAPLLGTTPQTVRTLCRRGALDAKWAFGCWHIVPESVDRFVAGLAVASATRVTPPSLGAATR